MNRHITYLMAGALLLTCAAGCTDQDYLNLDKGDTTLELTVSGSDIELRELNYQAEALSLDWTTGTNFGTGGRISYTLELALAGTDFADARILVADEQQVYEKSMTQQELNDMVTVDFGIAPGASAELEARVTATVGDDDSQTATVRFAVDTYRPAPATLFITGTATPGGADLSAAVEMERTQPGVFTFAGDLKAGDFKFIVNKGENLPSYNNNGQGGIVLRESEADGDGMFTVPADHYYQLTANLLDGTLTMREADAGEVLYDNLYFVGDMTDWGFVEMQRDPLNPWLFHYGAYFDKGGEFKFGTQAGSWENMFKATSPNAPYTQTSMELVAGFDPDNKWVLADDQLNQPYKITVDTRAGQYAMRMSPYTPYAAMYMIGDATAAGWDLAAAVEMQSDEAEPWVFTWSGTLSAGEIKFSCDKRSDWMGAWFMATSPGVAPTGQPEQVIFVDKSSADNATLYPDVNIGDVDNKWKITVPGEYAVTLNTLTQTVTFKRQ